MLMVGPGVGDGAAREADGTTGADADAEAGAAEGATEPDADAIGDPQPIATTALTMSAAQALSGGTWRWRRVVLDRVIERPSGVNGVRAW
jgi:hypothetical protein